MLQKVGQGDNKSVTMASQSKHKIREWNLLIICLKYKNSIALWYEYYNNLFAKTKACLKWNFSPFTCKTFLSNFIILK